MKKSELKEIIRSIIFEKRKKTRKRRKSSMGYGYPLHFGFWGMGNTVNTVGTPIEAPSAGEFAGGDVGGGDGGGGGGDRSGERFGEWFGGFWGRGESSRRSGRPRRVDRRGGG